jgi:hypothetical protein
VGIADPRRRAALTLLLALVAASGCRRDAGQKPRPAANGARRPEARVAAAFTHCLRGAGEKGPYAARRLGAQPLLPRGELLHAAAPATKGGARLVLGAVGDTKEALPETLERLGRVVTRMRAGGASLLVVLGGLDTSFEGQRAVLRALSGLPVVGLPGDRESRSGWQAALESLGDGGLDLTRARGIALPGASLIGVPGYFLSHHLHAKEQGCGYDRRDLERLARRIRALPQPRVLLSHGPPRGAGETAIDRAFGGVNIGDPELAELSRRASIRFGLFAHVHESAGRATTIDGRVVREGEWSDSLLLNVGAADSVPHEDLAGRWSRGTAALLELEGTQARFRMLEL